MGLAFSAPSLSWLRCEVPEETGVSVGHRSPKLVLIPKLVLTPKPILIPTHAGTGPCVPGPVSFVLTHYFFTHYFALQSQGAGREVWQGARGVMVEMAAKRGQYIPWGTSIRFPSSCLSEKLCSWLFFLAEMFCLSGCLMNCFDSSNCLPVLIGSAVWSFLSIRNM